MQTGLPRDLAEAENASPFFSRTLEGTSKPISRYNCYQNPLNALKVTRIVGGCHPESWFWDVSEVVNPNSTVKVFSTQDHPRIVQYSLQIHVWKLDNWWVCWDNGRCWWRVLEDSVGSHLWPTNHFGTNKHLSVVAAGRQVSSLSTSSHTIIKISDGVPLFRHPESVERIAATLWRSCSWALVCSCEEAFARTVSLHFVLPWLQRLQADIVAWTIENFEKVNTDSTESLKTFPVSLWKKILVSDDLVVMNEFHLLLAMINSSGLRPELLLMIRFTQFSWLDLMRVQLKQEFLVLSPALLAKAYRSCCVPRHLLQKLVRGDNPRKYTQVWRHLFTFSVQTSYEADECPKLSLKPEEPFEDFADFTLFFEPNGNATTQTVGNVCISCSGMTIPQGTSYTVSFMLVNQNDLSLLSFATRCEAAQNGTSIGCRVIASTEFCDLSNGWIVDGKALVDVIIVKG